MKDAKSLLLEVLAAIPGGEKVALLFAEDGVVDLPFLHSVGVEPRYKGRAAIAGFYDVVKQLYPDLVFKPEDIHVLIETPDQVFAEYIAHPAAAATGRRIHHMFAARLVAEGGEIKLLRESPTSSRRHRRSFQEVLPTCRGRPTRSIRSSRAIKANSIEMLQDTREAALLNSWNRAASDSSTGPSAGVVALPCRRV
jgi:hypothetical protein